MAKIPALTFIQFGTNVNPASEVGQFGSYAAPNFSGNINVMMSGTQYQRGWFAAVLNTNRQFIQDQNAIDIVFSNFIAYMQQMGIGEYVVTTDYDVNSIVQIAGQIYVSLQTNNVGNLPATSPAWWQPGLPGAEITGIVKAYAGVAAPAGYLVCNGAPISRTTYAALFSICGTNFGAGDGSTTFNLPDLRTKIPVGYLAGDPNFGAIGQTGGEVTHTLTVAEIPQHTHGYEMGQFGNTTSGSPENNPNGRGYVYTQTDGGTGGGGAHNNLQPYVTMNYIIKT